MTFTREEAKERVRQFHRAFDLAEAGKIEEARKEADCDWLVDATDVINYSEACIFDLETEHAGIYDEVLAEETEAVEDEWIYNYNKANGGRI